MRRQSSMDDFCLLGYYVCTMANYAAFLLFGLIFFIYIYDLSFDKVLYFFDWIVVRSRRVVVELHSYKNVFKLNK